MMEVVSTMCLYGSLDVYDGGDDDDDEMLITMMHACLPDSQTDQGPGAQFRLPVVPASPVHHHHPR